MGILPPTIDDLGMRPPTIDDLRAERAIMAGSSDDPLLLNPDQIERRIESDTNWQFFTRSNTVAHWHLVDHYKVHTDPVDRRVLTVVNVWSACGNYFADLRGAEVVSIPYKTIRDPAEVRLCERCVKLGRAEHVVGKLKKQLHDHK